MIIGILTTLLIVVGGFLAAFMAVYGFSHRKARGAISFAIFSVLITIWSFTYTFSILSLTESEKFFWIIMRNIGLFGAPAAWLFFSFEYTGRREWITKKYIALACILPIISLIVSATNDFHGLYYSRVLYERNGIFMNMNVTFGVWFWIQSFTSYLYMVIGYALILLDYIHSSQLYRRQTLSILAGVTITMLFNIIYVFLLENMAPIDITPISFSISTALIAYGLFYGRTFDVIPIAHHILVESMQDSLIVLDDQDRIIDINPAAEQLFKQPQRKVIGKSADRLFGNYSDLNKKYYHSRRDVLMNESHFNMRVTNVFNDQEVLLGRMVFLRDTTEEVNMYKEIQDLATIDSLTGIYNRRHFFEMANKELKRKDREKYPVSLMIMDVDHFKSINDGYGHMVGDKMLKQIAQISAQNIRQYDIIGRYGGEEFIILMPSTELDGAIRIAQRMCRKIKENIFDYDGEKVTVTVSIGLTCTDHNNKDSSIDQLLMQADKAMYAAKADGRNQVVAWNELMVRQSNGNKR